jgi:hypothetical protein
LPRCTESTLSIAFLCMSSIASCTRGDAFLHHQITAHTLTGKARTLTYTTRTHTHNTVRCTFC